MMESIIKKIESLKNSEIKNLIERRIKEFQENSKSNEKIFSELCFCLLTANFNALRAIKIQQECEKDFCNLNKEELAEKLKQHKHRFPNTRAKFIFECQKYKDNIKNIMEKFTDGKIARLWLEKNIKGLGMKESSHFLRNIGYKDIAIIDFHIIDLLVKEGIIEKPKSRTLAKSQYEKIEKILENFAKKTNLNLAELDLYLWYIETGKILK